MKELLQLARLWMTLGSMREQIDDVALPLGGHLGIEDPELMIALEELSAKITAHFERFKLVAVIRHTEQG